MLSWAKVPGCSSSSISHVYSHRSTINSSSMSINITIRIVWSKYSIAAVQICQDNSNISRKFSIQCGQNIFWKSSFRSKFGRQIMFVQPYQILLRTTIIVWIWKRSWPFSRLYCLSNNLVFCRTVDILRFWRMIIWLAWFQIASWTLKILNFRETFWCM